MIVVYLSLLYVIFFSGNIGVSGNDSCKKGIYYRGESVNKIMELPRQESSVVSEFKIESPPAPVQQTSVDLKTGIEAWRDIIHASSKKAKFGCNFDDNYNLQNPPKESGKIHIDPVWSEEEIQTVIFEDEAEFKEFLKNLNEVNDQVLKTNPFNTLYNLLDFWDAYITYGEENNLKSRRAKYLNKFFQGYQEKTTPKDGAFFTIELTNKMMEMYPKFAEKIRLSYLSTCNVADQTKDEWNAFKNKKISDDASNLPFDYFHDHVMGFMKFKIGMNSGITGVVVMDPGMMLNDIIVIMDSEEIYSFETTQSMGSTRYPKGKLHYYYYVGSYIGVVSEKPKTQYVRNTRYVGGVPVPQSTGKLDVVNQLCFIGKSYCSFQETTRKPWLTALDHSIMSHDRNGTVLAGLSLKLFDHMKGKAGLEIWFRNDKKVDLSLVFLKLDEMIKYLENVNQENPHGNITTFFSVGENLGKKKDEMKNLMKKIVDMFKDEIFTSQMTNLHDWFLERPHSNPIEPSLDIVY